MHSLFELILILCVLDLAFTLLDAVAASPRWTMVQDVRKHLMTRMATSIARLTNPINIARLAREKVISCLLWIVLGKCASHALQLFFALKFYLCFYLKLGVLHTYSKLLHRLCGVSQFNLIGSSYFS